jgi:CMP-N-acetylneuraminate monooxygenase
MFKNLGKLKYLSKDKEVKISLNQLKSGINFFESFIIYKNNNDIKIYNRICDHAGGKIISKDGNAICPVHMWKFNPSTGYYDNGVKKETIEFSTDKNFIKINDISYIPRIETVKKKLNTEVRYFNHAFLKISGGGVGAMIFPFQLIPGRLDQHLTQVGG